MSHLGASSTKGFVVVQDSDDQAPPSVDGRVGDGYETSHISRQKTRFNVDLDRQLGEELRDAVVYAQYHGRPDITQTALVGRSIRIALDELKQELGVGSFPPRGGRSPRPGRPPV